MGTIVKDGTIVYTHIDDIPRGAMEIRIPVPEGYVAEIISDGLIAIRPVESEDEKIREELIGHCKDLVRMNQDDKVMLSIYEPWLDWLEKQKDFPMPEDTVVFQKGVEEGRRLEREDMEKERLPIIETYQRSWYTEGYYDGKLKKEPRWIIKNQGICTKFEENPKYGQSLEEEQKPLPGFDDLTPDEKMNHPLYLEGFDAGREVGRVEAEQKPGWSEEDEKMVETICKEGDLKPSEQRWLKSLKNRGNFPKGNTNSPNVWSDEDERMRQTAIEACKTVAADYENSNARFYKCKEWLESLRPQPKQEWSEEDDAHLKRLCRIIHNQVVNKRLSLAEESELGNWMDKWLNHKPQPHWKPSEEQMGLFGRIVNDLKIKMVGVTMKEHHTLESLYDDLKKLM